jgi:hypothetical protein
MTSAADNIAPREPENLTRLGTTAELPGVCSTRGDGARTQVQLEPGLVHSEVAFAVVRGEFCFERG